MSRLLAEALYWLGDRASKVLARVPDDDGREFACADWYFIYNRLMVASMRVQGGGPGPWGPPNPAGGSHG